MGYEQVIPPVPTREQEKEAIRKLEDDWLAQPFYKYYMNENLRKKKMEHGRLRNRMWSDFLLNVTWYGILVSPLVLLVNRFYRFSATRVPTFFQPNHFIKYRTGQEVRTYKSFWAQTIVGVGLALWLTERNSDYTYIIDEEYQDTKDYAMM